MDIFGEAKKNFDYAVGLRRHLHENPEASGEEYETVRFVCGELEKLGIPYTEVPDGGVIGQIRGERARKPAAAGKKRKTVLLRADVDALPIQESETNLGRQKVCVSKRPGVSHACGHDAHTAMLLAEAKILASHKEELDGDIILCFERGEEYGGNVETLLPYLVHTMKLRPDTCMATHVKWDVDTGKISAEPGAVFSGGYGFTVKLAGRGGHGSRPDLARNPIGCFAAVYSRMEQLRMNCVPPDEILTYSIGVVSGGTARNVIPEELTFGGTVRTFSIEKAGKPFMDGFFRILDAECAVSGCSWELLDMREPMFECANNPTCSEIAREAVKKYIDPDALTKAEPWMASETMQAYLKYWPGLITFTGIRSEAVGSGANHHTPEFDLDERGMVYGIAAAVGYVVDFLEYEGTIPFTPYPGTLEELVARNL